MPSQHALRPLRGAPKERTYAVVDIEARKWVHPYAVGVYAGGTDYRQFDGEDNHECIQEALGYLLSPKFAGVWIYAHNGGNYDFLFLMRALLNMPQFQARYRVDLIPTGSTIISLNVFETEEGQHRRSCEDAERCSGCKTRKRENKLQRWSFLDSAKLMPLPLADLGEAFDVTRKVKLAMSYDDLAHPDNYGVMSDYLYADCVSLYEAIGVMQSRINALGGQIAITLPATSLDVFRRAFLRGEIRVHQHFAACPDHAAKAGQKSRCIKTSDDEMHCLHEFIRKAYFGGPAQIYRTTFVGKVAYDRDTKARKCATEEERIEKGLPPYLLTDEERASYDPRFPVARMYDINSHYPAMMTARMPVGEAIELWRLSEKEVFANTGSHVGIVECDVEIPRDCYLPPLPVEHNGKLMFPTGRLRGVWDAAELALLADVGGRIVQTKRSVWYESERIYSQFIEEIYKYRQKHEPDCKGGTCKGCSLSWTKGMDLIAKLLMNAAYGKYAMKVKRNKILVHPYLRSGITPIDLESDVWSEEVMMSPSYIVPQLAIHIVALARCKLWDLNRRVLHDGGRLYYNDTDSLVTAGVDIPTAPGIGELKLEATIHRAAFVLPKLYLVETEEDNVKKTLEKNLRIKAKGMGPGIRIDEAGDDPYGKELSEDDFRDLTLFGGTVTRHRLTKLMEGLRAYAKDKTEFPRVVPSPKSIQSVYDKRTVRSDFDTEPLYLEQW